MGQSEGLIERWLARGFRFERAHARDGEQDRLHRLVWFERVLSRGLRLHLARPGLAAVLDWAHSAAALPYIAASER